MTLPRPAPVFPRPPSFLVTLFLGALPVPLYSFTLSSTSSKQSFHTQLPFDKSGKMLSVNVLQARLVPKALLALLALSKIPCF